MSGAGSEVRLRAPTREDARAVLAVLVERDLEDLGAPDFTLEDLLDEWDEDGFDVQSDTRICEATDGRAQILGYASVRRPCAQVSVAPRHEGRGAGALLADWVERRGAELGWKRHRQVIAGGNSRAEALLRERGYELARSHWRMARALHGRERDGNAPAGVELRALRAQQDAATLHALNLASFAGSADEPATSVEAFAERHLRAHDLDPALSCVAERARRVVGFLLARRWVEQPVGYVDLLAVDPAEQGRGIGTAMLMRAFERFAAAELTEAQLGVAADNPGALRLYRRLGMAPRFQLNVYERALEA